MQILKRIKKKSSAMKFSRLCQLLLTQSNESFSTFASSQSTCAINICISEKCEENYVKQIEYSRDFNFPAQNFCEKQIVLALPLLFVAVDD